MAAWTAESLPILSTLASEYAVFDAWHSSIPGMVTFLIPFLFSFWKKFWSKASPPTDKLGPTEVNRAYLHSSTSDGCADGTAEWLTLGFPQKTLFQQFDDVCLTL
jgi:phospholipase C